MIVSLKFNGLIVIQVSVCKENIVTTTVSSRLWSSSFDVNTIWWFNRIISHCHLNLLEAISFKFDCALGMLQLSSPNWRESKFRFWIWSSVRVTSVRRRIFWLSEFLFSFYYGSQLFKMPCLLLIVHGKVPRVFNHINNFFGYILLQDCGTWGTPDCQIYLRAEIHL